MNRLTEKVYCGYDVSDRKLKNDYTDEEIFKVLQKLGRLEDIEEELGIDLITLFKALKKGIFVTYDSDFGMTNKPKIKILKDTATGICYRDKKWYIQENDALIKDYGKTWALTKEELL